MTKTTPKIQSKRVALYARVSSQKQKEEATIDSQLDALRLYAQESNYVVHDTLIFLDDGVSGTTLQRPALDELRDIIRFEPIEAVLIYAPDRLSRNYTHQLILMEEFRKHAVKVCFIKNPPKSTSPEEQMFQHFQGIFAEYERALILDRSRRGRLYKAKQGNPIVLPSLPYGYRRIKKEGQSCVIVLEEEAKVIREIYYLYIHEALSLSGVAEKITKSGAQTRKGGLNWDKATIRDILKNPTYLGTAHFGKTEKCEGSSVHIRKYGSKVFTKAKYARKKRPQEDWIAISIPQMVSESDFEQAQERLKKNKALASRNTKEPSLLQGLITCGICGQPFYKRRKKQKDKTIGYYYCRSRGSKKMKSCTNKSLRQDKIDNHIFQEVLSLLKTPTLIQQELDRRAKEASNKDEIELREIIAKKEFAKLSHESDRLLDAYQSGVIELKELKRRNQSLNILKRDLEKELKGLQAVKMEIDSRFEFGNLFEDILNQMNNKANKLEFDEKRKLVRLLVEQIVVHEDNISLVHCISPMALDQQKCLLKVDGGT